MFSLNGGTDGIAGTRGQRTRHAIVAASRELFLERGYGATTVNAIAEASGISRAGFYRHFSDKREIFGLLGDSAYRELRAVLAMWKSFDVPYRYEDVRQFVENYFTYMDGFGAFALSAAVSAPTDDEFRRGNMRMQTRVAWSLGQAVAPEGAHSPEVVGSALQGLLDRGWHTVQAQFVAVDRAEMIDALADTVLELSRIWSARPQ
ncbi:TetR/AcrR family transcriptional regulator [Mycobacterium sp. 48b]|uniref:TetR/AcrR family transcriptional regulator n=1 Tax=Mycobacterium sp. 48b TaxID=3400426 RepID=UPI003AABE065